MELNQLETEFAQMMDQCEAELQTEREILKMNVVPLQRHLVRSCFCFFARKIFNAVHFRAQDFFENSDLRRQVGDFLNQLAASPGFDVKTATQCSQKWIDVDHKITNLRRILDQQWELEEVFKDAKVFRRVFAFLVDEFCLF